jgi:peptidoglycan/LPS O-acetylase OafA/YrhL
MRDSGGRKLAGLDGLRGVAILLVMLFHRGLRPGWMGVQLFFVLSGFLITGLLVEGRREAVGRYLVTFYGRRALRIFPLYFAYLLALLALARVGLELPGLREGLPYAATYTYNLLDAAGATPSIVMNHLWSLSVEEQFYLLWPLVVFFLPRRPLVAVLASAVVLGPLVRLAEWFAFRSHGYTAQAAGDAIYVLLPSQIDAFAWGALVQLLRPRVAGWAAGAGWALVLAAGGLVIVFAGSAPESLGYYAGMARGGGFVWGYSLINAAGAATVAWLALGGDGVVFGSRPLRYIGRISYGLYMLHFPLNAVIEWAVPGWSPHGRLVASFAVSIGVASLSYHLFEARFLALKDAWFPAGARRPSPLYGTGRLNETA